jgi:hypothetical protein
MKLDRQLLIEEKDDFYIVKLVYDSNNVQTVTYPKNEIGLKNMYEFFTKYLRKVRINGVNKIYSFHNSPDILFDNSTKKMNIQLNSRYFKLFNEVVLNNYSDSRNEFFKNTDINEIRISAFTNIGKYEEKDGFIDLVLAADYHMNISVSEREFIRELIDYKCGNRKVDIEFIKEEKGFNKICIITCGEFKIVMPQGYTYSTIVGIAIDHNDSIDENRKRR